MTLVNNQATGDKIRANPKFQELVSKRTTFAWTLSAAMLSIYFGFILLIAYGKSFLGQPLSGAGTAAASVTTIGFPIGVAVILSAIVLTGIYVRRANTEFDELNRQIIEEAR